MSDENTNSVDTANDVVDLDTFSDEFFGQSPAVDTPEEPASPEDDQEVDQNAADEQDDVDAPDEDEPEVADEQDEEDDEPVEDPKPKRRNRAQERIEELNTKYRETQRELNELKAKLDKKDNEPAKPAPKADVQESVGPQPTDLNEDGTDKYPLGDFDPDYIRDLADHAVDQKWKAREAEEAKSREQEAMDRQRAELQSDWQEKLGPAKERYPDFDQKGQQIADIFEEVNPAYAEYLATTLMSMDHGTDVLYYLANHPDETAKIISSGPTKATITLGRIEARFMDIEAQKQLAKPKLSNAPTPPDHQVKGSAVVKTSVDLNVANLDDFSSEFFKKPKQGRSS